MSSQVDVIGRGFWRLTVQNRDERGWPETDSLKARWICECTCGGIISATGHELAGGAATDCGCSIADTLAHMELMGLAIDERFVKL